MQIDCPCCGSRDHSEFAYGGDATRTRPAQDDADTERWYDYVYLRANPRGRHTEFWQHTGGCREWLTVERDTVTHEIHAIFLSADHLQPGDTK